MDVSFEKPAIDQFCIEAQGIINIFNAAMKYFLKCFGVEEENGLSPFCRNFEPREELKHELELFFRKINKTSNKKTILDHSKSDQ